VGKRITRGRGNYETRKTNVEKKEVKNNQNTKQEKEKSKNDASLDPSDPSHSMLEAVHLETHRQCRKIQRGTYRNGVNQTETKTTDENLDPIPAPFAMHPIKPRQTIFLPCQTHVRSSRIKVALPPLPLFEIIRNVANPAVHPH